MKRVLPSSELEPTWTVLFASENPKRQGSSSAKRYEGYKTARTVGEALQLGAKPHDLQHDLKCGNFRILCNTSVSGFDGGNAGEAGRSGRGRKRLVEGTRVGSSTNRVATRSAVSTSGAAAKRGSRHSASERRFAYSGVVDTGGIVGASKGVAPLVGSTNGGGCTQASSRNVVSHTDSVGGGASKSKGAKNGIAFLADVVARVGSSSHPGNGTLLPSGAVGGGGGGGDSRPSKRGVVLDGAIAGWGSTGGGEKDAVSSAGAPSGGGNKTGTSTSAAAPLGVTASRAPNGRGRKKEGVRSVGASSGGESLRTGKPGGIHLVPCEQPASCFSPSRKSKRLSDAASAAKLRPVNATAEAPVAACTAVAFARSRASALRRQRPDAAVIAVAGKQGRSGGKPVATLVTGRGAATKTTAGVAAAASVAGTAFVQEGEAIGAKAAGMQLRQRGAAKPDAKASVERCAAAKAPCAQAVPAVRRPWRLRSPALAEEPEVTPSALTREAPGMAESPLKKYRVEEISSVPPQAAHAVMGAPAEHGLQKHSVDVDSAFSSPTPMGWHRKRIALAHDAKHVAAAQLLLSQSDDSSVVLCSEGPTQAKRSAALRPSPAVAFRRSMHKLRGELSAEISFAASEVAALIGLHQHCPAPHALVRCWQKNHRASVRLWERHTGGLRLPETTFARHASASVHAAVRAAVRHGDGALSRQAEAGICVAVRSSGAPEELVGAIAEEALGRARRARGARLEHTGLDAYELVSRRRVEKRNAESLRRSFRFGPIAFVIRGRADGFESVGSERWVVEHKRRQRRLFDTVPCYEEVQCQIYMALAGSSACRWVQTMGSEVDARVLPWCPRRWACIEGRLEGVARLLRRLIMGAIRPAPKALEGIQRKSWERAPPWPAGSAVLRQRFHATAAAVAAAAVTLAATRGNPFLPPTPSTRQAGATAPEIAMPLQVHMSLDNPPPMCMTHATIGESHCEQQEDNPRGRPTWPTDVVGAPTNRKSLQIDICSTDDAVAASAVPAADAEERAEAQANHAPDQQEQQGDAASTQEDAEWEEETEAEDTLCDSSSQGDAEEGERRAPDGGAPCTVLDDELTPGQQHGEVLRATLPELSLSFTPTLHE